MSSTEEPFGHYSGKIVPQSYNAGFVALSFVISLVGAGSTLELINRRTGSKGVFNHLLLVSSAVTMGGVAIWSMHFIGNRAIELADGEDQLQIAYSGGVTAVSFIVPIVVLLAAFVAVGSNNRVSWWRVGTGGVLCGAAVCGMHYLGNASIRNYRCVYRIENVVGAAAISVAASTVALSLFFVFRSIWANSWWKRLISAIILAGAVSGMHWVAAIGTQYRLLQVQGTGPGSARDATVIVVICLSVTACLTIAGSAVLKARRMNRSARRAQKVTLGAAVFDKYGRILVDTDGVVPSAVITDSFLEKDAREDFNIAHPMFHWMFQASRSWDGISNLVGGMKNHLAQLNRTGHGIELVNSNGEPTDNYDLVFRELFCVAAAELCDHMNQPLAGAGFLWDEILPTGAHGDLLRAQLKKSSSESSVTEKAGSTSKGTEYGRGSLMFLVRRVDNDREVDQLASAGYRFAEVHQVSNILRSRMQILSLEMESKLRQMARYASEDEELDRGVHLGFFGIRARVNASGFGVLVDKESKARLPSVSMGINKLEAWQLDMLKRFDGMTVVATIEALEKPGTGSPGPREQRFGQKLTKCILELRGLIQDPLFDEAVLTPRPVSAPTSKGSRTETMELLAFRLVIPIHCVPASPSCEFVPLSFFKVRQTSPQSQLSFNQAVYREFGLDAQSNLGIDAIAATQRRGPFGRWTTGRRKSILASKDIEEGDGKPIVAVTERRCSTTKSIQSTSTDDLGRTDLGSEASIQSRLPTHKTMASSDSGAFGGILVLQEITVGVEHDSHEMGRLGASARASHVGSRGRGAATAESFVDVLFAECVEGR